LIDPHVHLREPGATHKEDFDSGTAAALAGGFTTVLAMPNTQPPLTDDLSLRQAQDAARSKAHCDYSIFLGAGADNLSSVSQLASQACGLKMYLDQTYGPLHLEGLTALWDHIAHWPADRPLAVHAEGRNLAAALLITTLFERSLHVCHVSRKDEIALIRKAKEMGLPITCEVTPHHLFLTENDLPRLGAGRGEVRPRLATATDRDALWDNLDVIDCFATDHAPHTRSEKDGEDPPPGFPGLETALGLILTAVSEGRLTLDDLIIRSHTNPRHIFGLPEQHETFVEIDLDAVWEVHSSQMHTRCGWTPFEGMRLQGQVRRVTLRNKLAYADGEILVPPGYGKDLSPATHQKIE
jgi:carbamoyl-phosphate synthase/aspartate carbamoyltransferase/dihydroorotase